MAISNGKRYFTYGVKESNGEYVMAKTKNEGKILAFTDKSKLKDFIENDRGLARITEITEDIKIGNIPFERLEILD